MNPAAFILVFQHILNLLLQGHILRVVPPVSDGDHVSTLNVLNFVGGASVRRYGVLRTVPGRIPTFALARAPLPDGGVGMCSANASKRGDNLSQSANTGHSQRSARRGDVPGREPINTLPVGEPSTRHASIPSCV